MGVFSNGGVGIDLGSANVTICLENEGIVLREPSYVLTLRDDIEEIIAVGRDARLMLGRTPRDVLLHTPVAGGSIGDIDLAGALLKGLSDKALGRRRALDKSHLVCASPLGATKVERNALEATARIAGAKKTALLRTPVAAALGSGLAIDRPEGCMVIVIGGATTEVSVLSMNGIAAARSCRTGSLAFDEAIMRYVRREKGLIIGQRTAEDLKIDLGSALPEEQLESEEATLRGRDARTGSPATVSITAKDVHRAIQPEIDRLLETIREAFENTPAEMAEDILTRGITLSGGGSQLDGLAARLSDLVNLPVSITDRPQNDVAVGCCMAASDEKIAQRFEQSGCLSVL